MSPLQKLKTLFHKYFRYHSSSEQTPVGHSYRLWVSPVDEERNGTLGVEAVYDTSCFPYVSTSLELLEEEHDLTAGVSLYPFRLYVTLEGVVPYKLRGRYPRLCDRKTSFSLSEDFLWVQLFKQEESWRGRDEFGWSKSYFLKDVIMGKAIYDQQLVYEKPVYVEMPEGNYPATLTMKKVRWLRERKPYARWYYRAEIDVPNGIPIPGKGTASYNCGDDATFAQTFAIEKMKRQPFEYTRELATDILTRRNRYAGPGYVPDKGWPDHVFW